MEPTRYDKKETDGVETSASDSNQQLKDLILGVNHRISDDTKPPALLAFLELGLAENTAIEESDFVYGKNLQLGLTTVMQLSWRGGDKVNYVEAGSDISKTKLELGKEEGETE